MSIPASAPSSNFTRLGPGRLVLVVGPSGAGKDTVIDGARAACRDDPAIVFPRRTVTRPTSGHEDHDSLTDDAFDIAVGNGAFAFYWQAHGLKYGIPSAVDEDLRSGRTIVCNVSRAIVSDLRLRYARADTVLVTAPADVLLTRLAGRSRETDGSLAQRLSRNDFSRNFRPIIRLRMPARPRQQCSCCSM